MTFENLKLELEKKYYGNYRGIVREIHKDKKGLLQIEVLPFYKDIEAKDLPYAEPAFMYDNTSIPNIGSTVWVFFENGDLLKPVYFSQAIPISNLKEYTSESFKADNKTVQKATDIENTEEIIDNAITEVNNEKLEEETEIIKDLIKYPNVKAKILANGIVIATIDSDTPEDAQIIIYHPKHSIINIDKEGIHYHSNKNIETFAKEYIKLGSEKTIDISSKEDLSIKSDKNLNVEISENITINGKETKLEFQGLSLNDKSEIKIDSTGQITINSKNKITLKALGGLELDGGTGATFGVLLESCPCLVTGSPHINASKTIKGSI